MHTCTSCGTFYDGYACPRCGTMAPQNNYGAQQPYGGVQQPPVYYQPPPVQQYPAQNYQAQPPAYTPPPQYPQDPYAPQPVYAPMPPAPPKSGHGKMLLVIAVVIVIIIAAVAAAILFLAVTNPFNDAVEIFDGDTVSGNIAGSNMDDLYKIKLAPGEVLNATLNGPGIADFDIYIYENVLFWDEYIITGSATDSSIETISFVAWESEFYILDVYSYMGSGAYTLDVEITGTVSLDDGDNSISEAYPISSGDSITDAINEYYDADDYYEIYVNSGNILHAFLEFPPQPNTDLDLYIYDANGDILDVSEAAYGNEELNYYVTSSGYYYVNVWAYDGMGLYSISVDIIQVSAGDSNNSPGTSQTISAGTTISGSINQYTDTDDYYSIDVPLGQTMTVVLTGPNSADFDLYIWNNGPQIVAYSEELGSDETVVYITPTSDSNGRFYINPFAYSGYGTYTLKVTLGAGSTLSANAGFDRTVGTGQSVTFDATGSAGTITSYAWDFGDSTTGAGSVTTHSYSTIGTYTVTLTVSDGTSTDTDTATITVQAASSMPDKYALVIGISDYQGDDNDLNYCDEDADSWTSYLQSQGYTVRTLIDGQASRSSIIDGINWLEAQEDAGDYVAFVFSGHGGYSDRSRESYICAWNLDEGVNGIIWNSDLGTEFANFDSQHIFFFFDSCHSGGMDSVAGSGRYVSQTAGQLEYGLDAPKHEHGMWVYWFLVYSVQERGNTDMTQAYDVAYPKAVADAASGGNSMHPEEEFTGTSFYL